MQRDERTYALAANVTKLREQARVPFGVFAEPTADGSLAAGVGSGPSRRTSSSPATPTALNGGARQPNFYNQYAAFLLGLASRCQKSVQYEVMTTREWQHGIYARDRWQVNNKLTLDLGLRYEYYPLMTAGGPRHRAGRPRHPDCTPRRRSAGTRTIWDQGQQDPVRAPVGAVYRINEETVVRTGYGITYNPLPFSRPLRGFYPLTISGDFNRSTRIVVTTLSRGLRTSWGPT